MVKMIGENYYYDSPFTLHDVINGFRLADRNGALPHPPNNQKLFSSGPLSVRIDFWTWEFETTKFRLVRVIIYISLINSLTSIVVNLSFHKM